MPVLIILHGWQSCKERWQKTKEGIEQRSDKIRVIIPDLPGFKEETKLNRPWKLDDYVLWFEELFSSQINQPFYLAGHSFGARVALKFARKYPKAVKGLILISAAGLKPKTPTIAKALRKIPFHKYFSYLPLYDLARRGFYSKILKRTDYLRVEGMLKETFKDVISEDLTYLFKEIEPETLLIWGRNDEITPLEDGEIMSRKIKKARLEILETDHLPHLKCPEALAEKMASFVKTLESENEQSYSSQPMD